LLGKPNTHRSAINVDHLPQVEEETINHVFYQIHGHSRNASLSSLVSGLDDGKTSAGGDALISQGENEGKKPPKTKFYSSKIT